MPPRDAAGQASMHPRTPPDLRGPGAGKSQSLSHVRPQVRPRGHTALGGLLVERGLITEAQLESAINEHKVSGRRLGRVLVDGGVLTPEALLEVLSDQLGVPTTRVNAHTVQQEAI